MKDELLQDVFEQLGVTEPPKLGNSSLEQEERRNLAEESYKRNRENIQNTLKEAAQARSSTIRYLNIVFFTIIFVILIGIIIQFVSGVSNIVLIVQSACIAVLFPISQRIEKNVTKQAYIEFVSAFLPDLSPKEAIKSIDQLFQSLNHPNSLKKSIGQ